MTTGRSASFPWVLPILLAFLATVERDPVRAMPQGGSSVPPVAACDLNAVSRTKAEFQRLSALRRFDSSAVTMDAVRAASLEYVARAELCYQELYGPPTEVIDDGGVRMGSVPGAPEFNLFGTKWGSGSPFNSTGVDANGPRIPGGTVTYSFMADGIGGFPQGEGNSVAIGSLPTFSPCFIDEIASAFAVWSAIANIQFTQVQDNGAPFNAAIAAGDIRIAAHVFDGPSNILAHGFFPPPNGVSAAGDIHFDVAENWSCTPGTGVFDFGIVAIHEIGHAIGLNHETRLGGSGRPAIMSPFINPSVASLPLGDDINGAENIYGSAVGNSARAIVDFGSAFGVWILKYGAGWTQLTEFSSEQLVTGDLDGNGIDDIVVDFGEAYGVWVRMNNASWVQLHSLSPSNMAVGDLDNSGRDDIVLDFPGFGVWRWMNNASWVQLHVLSSTVFAIGNVDNALGDDVVATFADSGVWRWMNNTTWAQVSSFDADQIVIGDLDETASATDNADDIALHVPGQGLFYYLNLGGPVQLGVNVARMAAGDTDGDGQDELVVDFGPVLGISILGLSQGVTQLHTLSSESLILGDLDGNGQADIIVDFGEGIGLWIVVNNTSWIQAHELSPEGLAIGDLD